MYHDSNDSAGNTNSGVGVSVHSGFPNAAEDRDGVSQTLDFNKLLVRHPSSTYCFRVSGRSHEQQGIFDGDIAVIDRAIEPRALDLVLYFDDDNFIISQFKNISGRGHNHIQIWGVVTATIHQTRRSSKHTV